MKKQIVVTFGKDGGLVPFLEAARFALYQKEGTRWHKAETYEHHGPTQSTTAIRQMVGSLIAHFPDCRIIVSKKVSGIAYQTLDKSCFSIFEADSVSDSLLDYILQDVLESRVKADEPPKKPQSPLGDGHYFFNLAQLQKAHPEISSKRALMEFMTDANFLSLELTCDHLPPWMENVMNARGYEHNRKREGDGAAIYSITKK